MDLLDQLEIYIPVEAEVKTIPLWSLPSSVLRRMGLSDPQGSRRLSDSPEGVWICPAVLRRKGQKPAIENMSSLLARECRAAPGPFQMSVVSANRTAYQLLKDTMPGKNVSAQSPHGSLLPQSRAPGTYRAAVIIYNGRVYLSARRSNQRETQPASQTSSPPTTEAAAKRQKKVTVSHRNKPVEENKSNWDKNMAVMALSTLMLCRNDSIHCSSGETLHVEPHS